MRPFQVQSLATEIELLGLANVKQNLPSWRKIRWDYCPSVRGTVEEQKCAKERDLCHRRKRAKFSQRINTLYSPIFSAPLVFCYYSKVSTRYGSSQSSSILCAAPQIPFSINSLKIEILMDSQSLSCHLKMEGKANKITPGGMLLFYLVS